MTNPADAIADDPIAALDPAEVAELEAFLREQGIDPALWRARYRELARFQRSPEEEAKLAAEREEFRESTEALNRIVEEHGLFADALRELHEAL